MIPPAKPPTPKRRLLIGLTAIRAGLGGCQLLVLGVVMLMVMFSLCMALFFFARAAQMMP